MGNYNEIVVTGTVFASQDALACEIKIKNPQKLSSSEGFTELASGLEPPTSSLPMKCATACATPAFLFCSASQRQHDNYTINEQRCQPFFKRNLFEFLKQLKLF